MAEKTIEKKPIDITPHISILPKMGQTGYKFSEALSEFIENSMDALAEGQSKVKVEIDFFNNQLDVRDDAKGMNEKEAENAFRLAFSEGKKEFGQFGIGLKGAATSLGNKFKVITSKSGEHYWHILEFDERIWNEKKDWTYELTNIIKNNFDQHGTTITITDFKFPYYPNKVGISRDQLAVRYANFIKRGTLELIFNGKIVVAKEPELREISGIKKTPIKISFKDKVIDGWYGFLKKRNLGKKYGFDLFHHGRIIEENVKVGFTPHSDMAFLVGEINLDFVPVTINKRQFIETSPEYSGSLEALEKYLKDEGIISKARDLGKKNKFEKENFRLKDSIEELTKVTKLITLEDSNRIKTDYFRQSKFNISGIGLEKQKIKILKKEYLLYYGYANSGKEGGVANYYLDENNLVIVINADFPFYAVGKDSKTYSLFIVSELLAKVAIEDLGQEKFKEIDLRNYILKSLGELKQKEARLNAAKEKSDRAQREFKNALEEYKSITKENN